MGTVLLTTPGVTYHFPICMCPICTITATTINNIIFGDGILDVCDVYITYRRSLKKPIPTWYQRFWTNGVRVAELVPNVFNPKLVAQSRRWSPK